MAVGPLGGRGKELDGGLLALDHCQALHEIGRALVPSILLDCRVEEARDEAVAKDLAHRGPIDIPHCRRVRPGEQLPETTVELEETLICPLLGQRKVRPRLVAVRRGDETVLVVGLDLVESPGFLDVDISRDQRRCPGHPGLQLCLHTCRVPSGDIRHRLESGDPCSPCRGVPRFLEKRDLPHAARGLGRRGQRNDSIRDGLPQGLDVSSGQSQKLRGLGLLGLAAFRHDVLFV